MATAQSSQAGNLQRYDARVQVRVYRIQRDIPMPLVSSGVEKGNLRELALARMQALGLACRDVRTREAGIVDIHHQVLSCKATCLVKVIGLWSVGRCLVRAAL